LPQINEISKKLDFVGGAALQRGYGCSAPKGEMHHPRVQETFPENVVEIA